MEIHEIGSCTEHWKEALLPSTAVSKFRSGIRFSAERSATRKKDELILVENLRPVCILFCTYIGANFDPRSQSYDFRIYNYSTSFEVG
jgi:hypothetical protein